MKKLLFLCSFFITNVFCSEVEIIEYNSSHKDAIMEISFQDPLQFFCGSHVVKAGLMPAELFESENRKGMETILNDSLRIKKVLIDSGKVIGFIEFFKSREMSLESLKRQMESQGLPFDETQILAELPHLKKTDAECDQLVVIECLAIDKNYRGKGYSRTLVRDVESTMMQLWPIIKIIQLNVNEQNQIARKLYESEGFEVSSNQLAALKVVQYAKKLQ